MKALIFMSFFLLRAAFSQDCPFCAVLEIKVTGLRNDSGLLRVLLTADEQAFQETDPKKIDVQKIHFKNEKISKGSARIIFPKLQSGTYAYKIFHDENANEV